MAAKGDSSVQVQKSLEGFISILTSAACEWFLIFLLFFDGLLSCMLTKFAAYCNLQKPCIFCSRFEHVIGNERPQLYQDLLCSNHISELSSWIASQLYGKDDGNGVPRDCPLSFTKKNQSKPEKHKMLGKSDLDLGSSGSKTIQNRNIVHSFGGVRPCSCGSRPYRPRENAQGLQKKSSGSKPNIPLPRFSRRSRPHRRDGSKKIRDKFSTSVTPRRPGKTDWDPLPHVGYNELKFNSDTDSTRRRGKSGWDALSNVCYTELKISSDTNSARRPRKIGWDSLSHVGYTELKVSSDTDSEFPFSDDDGGNSLIIGNYEPEKKGFVVQYELENSFKASPNGLDPEKKSNVSYEHKPSLSNPCVHLNGSKASGAKLMDYNIAFENVLGEPNSQQASRKSNPSALPELISLHDITPSSNIVEKYVTGTSDFVHTSSSENDKILKYESATDGASVKHNPIINDPATIKVNHIGVHVGSESAGTGKERDLSSVINEQSTVKEPDGVDWDLKPLDSKNASAHESNLSLNNTISRVDGLGDEKQVTDASNFYPKQVLRTSASVESGLESLDEEYVSEIEGESIVDRLKRQVEYYRKCINEMFKELDEERNASTIAANQAMAMITKLQEEKAAIHMEALQYLRMMEEQAEFDVEALEKANDLLAEKEKEIQDLEAELEFSKFDGSDELIMENMPDNLKGEINTVESLVAPNIKNDAEDGPNELIMENMPDNLKSEINIVESLIAPCMKNDAEVTCNSSTVAPSVKNDAEVTCNSSTVASSLNNDVEVTDNSMVTEVPKASNVLFSETTLLEFEDEKLYISNCLKSLERKLSEISCNGASSIMPNGGSKQGETPRKERIILNGVDENIMHGQSNLHISNRTFTAEEEPIHSDSVDHDEKDDSDFHGEKYFTDHKETDLIVLENEISDLNDRLEALETDHDFLEHMLYSLQNGDDGLQFIQEIAQQLRELRKIGIAFRCQSAS